jgi:hypothetical protein
MVRIRKVAISQSSYSIRKCDEVLRFMWIFLQIVGPHGFAIEEVTTTTLPKRTFSESLTGIRGKTNESQTGKYCRSQLGRDDDIIAVYVNPRTGDLT